MNRQQRKRMVREFVLTRQTSQLTEMARNDRRVVGALCALLYDQDDQFRWQAVEALGAVSATVAESNVGTVRELLRRLEWLMNDESGGAGWHSPEAMAAIVVNVPDLADTFGVILGAHLDDEPLARGAHWAVAAISKVRPDLFADKADLLVTSLESSDPFIRGYALIALGLVEGVKAEEYARQLENDEGELEIYSRGSGELHRLTVGELAKRIAAGGSAAEGTIDAW